MRKKIRIFALALLSGCSSLPELPKTTSVPVAVSCIPKLAPSLPAVKSKAELAALADEALVLTIAAERNDLLAYGQKADAVIKACR